MAVGEDELSAFAADLGLDLETIVTHWEPREIVLHEEYRPKYSYALNIQT